MWQRAAGLKHSPSSNPGVLARGDVDGRMRPRGETMHCETTSLARRSDAAYSDQPAEGTCLLGHVIALMSPALRGPRHILQWASKFTRKLVKGSPGDGEYAFSKMIDHMSLLREFYKHSAHASPGMVAVEDCESPFARLKKNKTITEEYSIRHSLGARHSSETEE